MHVREMISTHADVQGNTADRLLTFIEQAYDCAQACTSCADACLAEDMVADLRQCIRLNLDCADICATTGRVVSRQTAYDADVTGAMLRACIEACRSCADECEIHAAHGMEHCRVCAAECRSCEQACQELLAAIA